MSHNQNNYKANLQFYAHLPVNKTTENILFWPEYIYCGTALSPEIITH